jgi:hypothetical protein
VGHYKLLAGYTAAERKITYTRELVFGMNGAILFPSNAYPALKKLFDLMHQADEHVLTLKQAQQVATQ